MRSQLASQVLEGGEHRACESLAPDLGDDVHALDLDDARLVPVAMGGVRRHEPGVVEIKRMYVVPEVRGQGLARAMLAALEDRARELGAHRVVLETASKQPEAVRLYETSGYSQIDGFGHYRCQPLSISYGKSLAGAGALSG
jgi:GNAT superfamily N-acetyltransferase